MSKLTPDIAEIEVEAIEKVVSVSHVEPTVPALTIDTVADSPLLPMTRIGIDAATGADVMVGDRERCGGFYILGQPRTGKSNLLISMALSDIEKGTSMLFIDPHTDAITDLLSRIPQERRKPVILKRDITRQLMDLLFLKSPLRVLNSISDSNRRESGLRRG